MRGVRLTFVDTEQPFRGLEVGDRPARTPPEDWVRVGMRAASINRSDLAMMSGFGLRVDQLPIVLGSDGVGVDDDGNRMIVYPIVNRPQFVGSDPMLDPDLRMLSQGIDGTFADEVWLPRANLIPAPPELSWETLACLGTAWLTAYRMLFGRADIRAGEAIAVYGAGGGVATALIVLAVAAGIRVWVVTRDRSRGERAVDELGAEAVFTLDQSLPQHVDAAMDSVGAATFHHALHSLRPGGRLVVAGASAGARTYLDIPELFLRSITVIGSAMGSRRELSDLAAFCVREKVMVPVDSTWPLTDADSALRRFTRGDTFGKVVLDHTDRAWAM